MSENSNNKSLQTLPYCGCVDHWARIIYGGGRLTADGVYQRRTFRSRTIIMSANGPLAITVPVVAEYGKPYRDIRLNYDTDWATQHLRAIMSAYSSSPFYEYFVDDFERVYSQHYDFLVDFNVEVMSLIAELMGVTLPQDVWQADNSVHCEEDLRIAIEPKFQHLLRLKEVPYYQVFTEKYGFVPHLSILDLLFNMGRESRVVLRAMAEVSEE
ncbi:MAG: WbqC family protein [Bacteroidales bacterium]|nr:WbqC family protein [Bacteroidales bacterium]